MNQIAAIALLALRNALRSRVILVLLLLVLAAAFLLPHAIRHDGTPEGLIRLHLAYSLGIAGFLLTLASLWAGCAAISQEADDKTLQLVLVKPVPRLRIWLGKWLALLLINALLLTVVGILDAVTLQAALRRSQFEPEALARARQTTLAALEPVQAPLPDIKTEVQAEYEALRARHLLPENVPESTLLDSIKRTLLARAYAIPPGGTHAWRFRVPAHLPPTFFVQFKADSSVPGSAEIQARLDVHIGGHIMSREIDAMPGTRQMLLFTNSPSCPIPPRRSAPSFPITAPTTPPCSSTRRTAWSYACPAAHFPETTCARWPASISASRFSPPWASPSARCSRCPSPPS